MLPMPDSQICSRNYSLSVAWSSFNWSASNLALSDLIHDCLHTWRTISTMDWIGMKSQWTSPCNSYKPCTYAVFNACMTMKTSLTKTYTLSSPKTDQLDHLQATRWIQPICLSWSFSRSSLGPHPTLLEEDWYISCCQGSGKGGMYTARSPVILILQ